jgi:hypothetical protein
VPLVLIGCMRFRAALSVISSAHFQSSIMLLSWVLAQQAQSRVGSPPSCYVSVCASVTIVPRCQRSVGAALAVHCTYSNAVHTLAWSLDSVKNWSWPLCMCWMARPWVTYVQACACRGHKVMCSWTHSAAAYELQHDKNWQWWAVSVTSDLCRKCFYGWLPTNH